MAQSVRDCYPDVSEELDGQRAGFSRIAGVDEAGRGSWAGPLVAAAVILPLASRDVPDDLLGVRDSKLLSPARRAVEYEIVVAYARAAGIGAVTHEEIDGLGLSKAGELAMLRALEALPIRPDFAIVDGFRLRACPISQKAIVRADQRCLSVAAASIVAKVVRDRWLCDLDRQFPEYGFARHKGYGTAEHIRALRWSGPSPVHRRSYAPIAKLMAVVGA